MRCPACKAFNDDKVIDSRMTDGGSAVRRRRVCQACGRRFTTKERIEAELRLTVIKRDGNKAPYRRDKIVRGVLHACYKLDVTEQQIEELADRVEGEIFRDHERSIQSEQVGQYVSAQLRALNPIAYVRFMSVFRKFKEVAEFVEELEDVVVRVENETPDQQSLFEA